MFDKIPPIYRKLIYEYLDPKDLMNIGKTCRSVYGDENRISSIVDKISCTFGYNIGTYLWRSPFLFDKMPPNILNPLKKEFEKRTLSVKFTDIEKLSFEDKTDLIIMMPLDLFFSLETNVQEKIIFVMCEHVYQITEKKIREKVYRTRHHYLNSFYIFIIDTLCRIFKETRDMSLRIFIIDNLVKFDNKQLERCIVSDFILGLFRGDITQLELMIEIGLFFQKHFPHYLKEHFECCLEGYMNFKDEYENTADDVNVEIVEEILNDKSKIFTEMSNAQVLEQLLSECKLYSCIHDNYKSSVIMIRDVNKKRYLRYINQTPR